MPDMAMDISHLKERLREAPYEPELGVRLVRLAEAEVAGKVLVLVAVQLDPGKALVPHLHELDDEIILPVTPGMLQLGKAQRNEHGNYVVEGDKIVVDWNEPQELESGKPLRLDAAEAHYLFASRDRFVLLFFLPETHLGEDRKFVIYPPRHTP